MVIERSRASRRVGSAGPHGCSACGHECPRWFGRCPGCGSWGTAATLSAPNGAIDIALLETSSAGSPRLLAGVDELDRVLGGGLVRGSVALLAGDPGVGKSTLVLQLVRWIAEHEGSTLLLSGEESLEQVALRAARLRIPRESLLAGAATSLEEVLEAAGRARPDVLFVDSIQTLRDDAVDGAAGSVVQVRECAARLVRYAKDTGTAVVLTGHVTKDGSVAGPKVLEHVVDVVLTLEGSRTGSLRLLRALKNRFGSCEEVGVFEMTATGLDPVDDPSAMVLADRHDGISGSVVFPSLEGSRPVLVELQALVVPGATPQPRRTAIGLDSRRLNLILGVLDQTASIKAGAHDVFVSAAGGLAVREPAADLAICVALQSAVSKVPIDPRTAIVGEIGLGGEVRRVPGVARRISECARLGFQTVVGPRDAAGGMNGTRVVSVSHIEEALEVVPRLRSEGA